MEIIWLTEKVVDPETDVITHIEWSARAWEGVFEAREQGRAKLPAPDPELVAKYLIRPTPEQEKRGVTWDDLADPPGFMRAEWVERDKLHPWLFGIIDRSEIEARLIAQVRAGQSSAKPLDVPEPPAAPYVPDFTLIPDQLAKYAEADESAEDFRKRAFSILFRFGIAEGENFEGGGEPLSPEEKIRLLPMLIANFAAGNWLNLTEDLKP